jgi:integrase
LSTQSSVSQRHSRYRGKRAQALASLNRLLAEHIRYDAKHKKVISNATKADRRQILSQAIRDLHAAGYKIEDVRHFGLRHAQVLAALWESREYSASTLQKRFSVLAVFCRWIGKPGMLGDPRMLLRDPTRYDRTYQARWDKSWEGQGFDVAEVLAKVQAKDPVVALQLQLEAAFGLRTQEAMLLRPHLADQGEWLAVNWGTKGGRPRRVPIETPQQRQVLDAGKRQAPHKESSTIPARYPLKAWKHHYYYVLRCCGITREQGLVAHGLRHGYAHRRYETLAGQPCPVRGGKSSDLSREADKAARVGVSHALGHARASITNAYCGGVRTDHGKSS